MGDDPIIPLSVQHQKLLDHQLSRHADPLLRLWIFRNERKNKEEHRASLKEWIAFNNGNPNIKMFRKKDEDLENRHIDVNAWDYSDFFHYVGSQCLRQENRFLGIRTFTSHYDYVKGTKVYMDNTTYIVQRSDKCFASAWAAVHGWHLICMVTSRDMDVSRLPAFYHRDCLKQQNLICLAEAVIAEVECIPDEDAHYRDPSLHKYTAGHVKSPFCLVSAGMLERNLVEGFFCITDRSTLKSDTESVDGTIQAAIRAYQDLRHQVVSEAEDIWVTVMPLKSGCFDDLPIDTIKKHLAKVNGSSSP